MIVKTYDVFCDVEVSERCRVWDPATSSTENSNDTRRRARKAGWRRTNGQDICPECQEDSSSWLPSHNTKG